MEKYELRMEHHANRHTAMCIGYTSVGGVYHREAHSYIPQHPIDRDEGMCNRCVREVALIIRIGGNIERQRDDKPSSLDNAVESEGD